MQIDNDVHFDHEALIENYHDKNIEVQVDSGQRERDTISVHVDVLMFRVRIGGRRRRSK